MPFRLALVALFLSIAAVLLALAAPAFAAS